MSGSGSETLTAALRRLADEHASGLLSVTTPDHDVVMELADGVPVGIGPTLDVSGRVGRGAGPSLMAAAIVDGLIDRTVAAIIGGDGDWTWDVTSGADMMPVPQGLAAELSRRAVDAAQALATLDPRAVLQPGRDLETTGEVDRLRDLFDGERSIAEVADEAGVTVPACATVAAALVRAGVLSTGVEDVGPPSWTDTVAGAAEDEDEDEDEPEPWVMDEPDQPDDVDDVDEPDDEEAGGHEQERGWAAPASRVAPAADAGPVTGAAGVDRDGHDDGQQQPGREADPATPAAASTEDVPAAMEWVVDEPAAAASHPAPGSGSDSEDGWDDTTWLDDLDGSSTVQHRDEDAPAAGTGGRGGSAADPRSALSSMINELQGSSSEVQPREQAPPARTAEDEERQDEQASRRKATDATRKEPKAEPGEVAEFLRELSRLALDDD